MSVGENIKARRLALGMTQENLAQAVGLGRSMVAQIERGSKSASIQLGVEIAKVLQCNLNDLVSEVDGNV
ncbi:MAG: helix-turn-helix domain-containing protein [Eubacterium sp.]|nr:helix-turn-helix domain-containing protein [Eubacterium sp.]